MTFDEIETLVGQHLAAMDDVPPIAWPNAKFIVDGTYIEFRHAPIEQIDETISGGYAYHSGLFLITVVTEAGKHNTEANTLAQAISNHFPKALRISSDNGNVLITSPPSLGSGFQDGVFWRQPVRISYITEPEYAAPEGTGTGELDFSNADNSGLIVLFME